MRPFAGCLAFAVLVALPATAQQKPAPRLGGFLVLAREIDRGTPIVKAVIAIAFPGNASEQRKALTDSSGFARFDSLPTGKYILNATAAGYDSYTWLHTKTGIGLDTLQINLRQVNAEADSARTGRCNDLLSKFGFAPRPDACAFIQANNPGICPRGMCDPAQEPSSDIAEVTPRRENAPHAARPSGRNRPPAAR